MLQLLILHLDSLEVVLLGSKLLHASLILSLGSGKGSLLRFDLIDNLVVLFHLEDPLAKALGRLGGLGHTRGLELRILQESLLDLLHNDVWNVVFVVVL